MLQPNKIRPETDAEPATANALSHAETLYDFIAFARRQFYVIAFIVALAVSLGVIYTVTARPSYTAQAELMIDARKLQLFQQQSILGDIPIDTAQVESQVEVLKSENIALAVIKNLHLTEDPEFTRPDVGLFGTILGFVYSPFESEHTPSQFEITRSAVQAFESKLNIKRIGMTYVIQISFRSYNPEHAAEIANAVADAYIVDQLEAKYQATRRASAWLQDRIKELRDQVSIAERAVVDFKSKNDIVTTGGPDKRLLGEQQVAELNSQLVIARANTAEARARLDRIQSVLRSDTPDAIGATVTDTLKSEIVSKLRSQYLDLAARESDWSVKYGHDHLAVVNVRNQMRELQNSIFQELRRLGETYKSDYEIAKKREEGLRSELDRAVAQSQVTDEKSVTLRELQSTAQTYKTIYDNFLQRYMEAVQQQSFPITEARLISTATRPLFKSNPRTRLILMITGLGGMMLGFGLGVLRDLADRVFRTSKQVENLLHAECIGFVPLLKDGEHDELSNDPKERKSIPTAGAARRKGILATVNSTFARLSEVIGSSGPISGAQRSSRPTRPDASPALAAPPKGGRPGELPSDAVKLPRPLEARTIARADSVEFRAVVDAPFSRFVESIRAIKLSADLSGNVDAGRVIGFTSSLPNEGKSTIALAFAQLTSQVGARTILVDCDLRNPSISRQIAATAKVGLLDVVAGKATLEEAIWTDPVTKMEFLPAVIKSRLANSSEILSSVATRKLFEQLRERYTYIVADFSPIAPIVDVRATTHLVDSFVFVIEWGRTKIDVVEHALDKAPAIYENLLGVVLNKVDMNKFGRYVHHHGDYYYNKHYARYGYTE